MDTKTKEEIVIETILYYTVDGNAIAYDQEVAKAVSITEAGAMCSLTRLVKEKYREDVIKLEDTKARVVIALLGDEILLDAYQGHEQYFWSLIQRLHDVVLVDYLDNADPHEAVRKLIFAVRNLFYFEFDWKFNFKQVEKAIAEQLTTFKHEVI